MNRLFIFLALLAFNYFFSFKSLADKNYNDKGMYIGIGSNTTSESMGKYMAPVGMEQEIYACNRRCEELLKSRKDNKDVNCLQVCSDSAVSIYNRNAGINSCRSRCEKEKSSGVLKTVVARNCDSECGVANYEWVLKDNSKLLHDFEGCEKSADEMTISCPFGQYKRTQTINDQVRGITNKGSGSSTNPGVPVLHGVRSH